jgi:hypothetical protein
VVSGSATFRLRLLLQTTTGNLYTADNIQFKLQYATKVGTCDTAFSGETYTDVGTPGSADTVQFADNPSVSSPTAMITESGEDPTDGSNTVVPQSINEANTWTNDQADVPNLNDGMWDFPLQEVNAFGSYCFRVVDNPCSVISNYTQVPEISFCRNSPKSDSLMRHGTYFCGGLKKPFFWAS